MTVDCYIYHHADVLKHLTGSGHPEAPERYTAIIRELKSQGLLTAENERTPAYASQDHIALCHSQAYIDLVERECQQQQDNMPAGSSLSTGDVPICKASFDCARLACGAGLSAIDAILQAKVKTAFCCVRPPGHHARPQTGMGFCLFNNIAIAARYAQKKYGLSRVAIIDWDVHHGNGTQDIFEKDASVLYFSTHQQDLYPGTGAKEEIGVGNIFNCPIHGGLGSRLNVLEAFNQKLTAALEQFKPQLLLISAGFDAHKDDPLGGFDLTEEDFGTLTTLLLDLAKKHCQGRLISMLEGGYNLRALAKSVAMHIKALQNPY